MSIHYVINMNLNQSREDYIQYVAEFDKKVKSGDIFEEEGAFYENTPVGGRNRLVGRLTYSEFLLEKILLSLKK